MKVLKSVIILVFISVASFAQDGLVWKLDFQKTGLGNLLNYELISEGGKMEYISLAYNASVVDDSKRPKSLRIKYPKGAVGPSTIGHSGSQFIKSIPDSEEYYLDYYVKFEEGFDFQKGGKLPGLTSGGSQWTGGNHPEEGQGWSARYMWVDNGRMVVYLYYVDMPGAYGEPIELNMNFKPGKWYRLTQRIKLNDVYTAGNGNGILQVWVDGKMVIDKHNYRFRFEGKGLIDSFYFSTFFGGASADWAPDVDSYTRFDKFRVTTIIPDFNDEIDPPVEEDVINADIADATIWDSGEIITDYINLFAGKIGDVGVSGSEANVVNIIPFKLPTLPNGKLLKSAKLSINVDINTGWQTANYDVYALPVRVSSEVLFTDYYTGDYGDDAESTAIQSGMFAIGNPKDPNPWSSDKPYPGNPPVEILLSDQSSELLADFINAEYVKGAQPGQYVFLRINQNRDDAANWNYTQIVSANAKNPTHQDLKPKLILTYKDGSLSNDKIEFLTFDIYPNPVINGEFYISNLEMGSNIVMNIYSVTGELVNKQLLKTDSNSTKVFIELQSGLYFVKITDGSVVKTQKIIVQ